MVTWEITIFFTDGILKGLTITEKTTANFTVGKEYKDGCSSDFIVISKKPL